MPTQDFDALLNNRGLDFGDIIERPVGFNLPRSKFPFDFHRDATGRVRTNFDRKVWAPTPDVQPWVTSTIFYVDVTRSTDSGDGLTWATAKRAINSAITAGNATNGPFIVYVRAGVYPRSLSVQGAAANVVPSQPCALIAVGGRVATGMWDALTWTLESGTTYQASRSGIRRAVDLSSVNQWGLNPDYTWAASLEACRATPGSWFTDNTTVYINRPDGSAVTDANSRAYMNVNGNAGGVRMTSSGNMYVSGFDFQGGTPALLTSNGTGRFVAEDCSFRYSSGNDGIVATPASGNNGVTITNIDGAAFIRCDASGNQSDGFNPHAAASVNPFMFTMDCTAFNNGRQGSFSCNGLTTHDGNFAIDLRGIVADNAGGQIAIVNDNTQMWCIDTMAYASRGDTPLGGVVAPADFLVDQGSPTLFLDNCAASRTPTSIYARNGAIRVHSGKFAGAQVTVAGGAITNY